MKRFSNKISGHTYVSKAKASINELNNYRIDIEYPDIIPKVGMRMKLVSTNERAALTANDQSQVRKQIPRLSLTWVHTTQITTQQSRKFSRSFFSFQHFLTGPTKLDQKTSNFGSGFYFTILIISEWVKT